ncbi:hypothetical protein [Kutzneria buriramensis]|uniref:hypothetical protein n=1 Tax=Kutzneria buriramensis TaxID=1045776 RepID=UPI000E23AD25|nr:hypothetical protein [Kutzneria buriramensis]
MPRAKNAAGDVRAGMGAAGCVFTSSSIGVAHHVTARHSRPAATNAASRPYPSLWPATAGG